MIRPASSSPVARAFLLALSSVVPRACASAPAAALASVLALLLPAALAAQDARLAVDGAELRYRVEGEGPPVVLIHGWTHDVRSWDLQTPTLAREHTVLRWDRRGFGESTGHADVSADPVDLDALMEELGLGTAFVVGHSQGGEVALRFALAHPERVRGLVLYGAGPPEGFGVPWTGPDAISIDMAAVAREHGLDSLGTLLFRGPLARGFEEGGPGAELVQRMWESYSGDDLLDPEPPSGATPAPTMEALAGLDVPALVVTGEWEMPYFRLVADAMAYAIPGAERRTVEGGGHAVHMQEPERFTAELLRFFRDVERREP